MFVAEMKFPNFIESMGQTRLFLNQQKDARAHRLRTHLARSLNFLLRPTQPIRPSPASIIA